MSRGAGGWCIYQRIATRRTKKNIKAELLEALGRGGSRISQKQSRQSDHADGPKYK